VAQTPLLAVGCVILGQWCFDRRRPWLGTLLWAVPFIKPHIALPLLPLAWYAGGWKRAAGLVAGLVALNVAGAVVAGGSPDFVRDYLGYVRGAHKEIPFNRAELNPEITSWNRLLVVLTDTAAQSGFGRPVVVEQTAAVTGLSYLVWF